MWLGEWPARFEVGEGPLDRIRYEKQEGRGVENHREAVGEDLIRGEPRQLTAALHHGRCQGYAGQSPTNLFQLPCTLQTLDVNAVGAGVAIHFAAADGL